jgi:hypothetical protein
MAKATNKEKMTEMKLETERFKEDEDDPSFIFSLVEDPNLKNQLFGFRKEKSSSLNPIHYRSSKK